MSNLCLYRGWVRVRVRVRVTVTITVNSMGKEEEWEARLTDSQIRSLQSIDLKKPEDILCASEVGKQKVIGLPMICPYFSFMVPTSASASSHGIF